MNVYVLAAADVLLKIYLSLIEPCPEKWQFRQSE